MRPLNRNKSTIYFAQYIDSTEILEDGLRTGQFEANYGAPIKYRANVLSDKDQLGYQPYGIEQNFDKILVVEKNCIINDTSNLWIENLDTTLPHDYIVTAISNSLNGKRIFIAKVKTNAGDKT
jgi:hypothetical protein